VQTTLSSLLVVMTIAAFWGNAAAAASSSTLTVHEWGTFTAFQSEAGTTIAGINVDDEPVPAFVHRLKELPIFTSTSLPALWSQGAPRCHAGVTLRLETPVLYFYPQPGFALEQSIDVRVRFNGGWLTEFYPAAAADMPGFPDSLESRAQGDLSWTGLRLQSVSAPPPPATDEPVWLAPRQVRSANVSTKDESEQYLFYRGVGHLDAPIVTEQAADHLKITLRKDDPVVKQLPMLWLVRVLPDGRLFYRTLRPTQTSYQTTLPTIAAGAVSQVDALRTELSLALAAEGLYPDEAEAMLKTWQLSYFDSEGLRVFFLLPQSWTDHYLPLSISAPAAVTRVMMGRVELISATQRAALQKLYALPDDSFQVAPLYSDREPDAQSPTMEQVSERQNTVLREMHSGRTTHAGLYESIHRKVPEALQLYDSLGRFRDPLLAQRWRAEADPARRSRIGKIITTFGSCIPNFQAENAATSGIGNGDE
jgi:hypothetical protein